MGRVVAAAVYSAGKKVTDITLDEGAAWAAKPDHFVWIGLEEPSAQELANLQRQFNLHELAIEDALEKHSRPKLETFGDALFIVTYSPVRENGKLEFIETHIFAGNGYIITARNGHSASYGFMRQRCEARPLLLEHGEDFVLYALLDFVTENYQPVSEAIHAEIDELERNVLCSSLSEHDIQTCTACAAMCCGSNGMWRRWWRSARSCRSSASHLSTRICARIFAMCRST